MACASQVMVSHRIHHLLPEVGYHNPGETAAPVQICNMLSIQNMWTSKGSCGTGPTSGSKTSQRLIHHSIFNIKATAKGCIIQYIHLQKSFPQRLCHHCHHVWTHWFIFHADGTFFNWLVFIHWLRQNLQGKLEHRHMKRLYSRTNKNGAIKQITRHERRETRMRKAQQAAKALDHRTHTHHAPLTTSDPLPYTNSRDHHHMLKSRRHHQDFFSFSKRFPHDPATKVMGLCFCNRHTTLVLTFWVEFCQ